MLILLIWFTWEFLFLFFFLMCFISVIQSFSCCPHMYLKKSMAKYGLTFLLMIWRFIHLLCAHTNGWQRWHLGIFSIMFPFHEIRWIQHSWHHSMSPWPAVVIQPSSSSSSDYFSLCIIYKAPFRILSLRVCSTDRLFSPSVRWWTAYWPWVMTTPCKLIATTHCGERQVCFNPSPFCHYVALLYYHLPV